MASIIKIVIKSDSTVTEDTPQNAPADWTTVSKEWDVNPADSQAWEWADIDALQIGLSIADDGHWGLCTQVYVEVDYTPAYNPATRTAHMAAKMIAGKLI